MYGDCVNASDYEALLNGTPTGLNPPTSPGWVSANVTSILSSWSLINSALLYLDRSNTRNLAWCDAAYLLVDYTEGVQPGWNKLNYEGDPQTGAWNKLIYISEPPVPSAWNKLKVG